MKIDRKWWGQKWEGWSFLWKRKQLMVMELFGPELYRLQWKFRCLHHTKKRVFLCQLANTSSRIKHTPSFPLKSFVINKIKNILICTKSWKIYPYFNFHTCVCAWTICNLYSYFLVFSDMGNIVLLMIIRT